MPYVHAQVINIQMHGSHMTTCIPYHTMPYHMYMHR